jgi:hypothetical protein
LVAVLMCVYRKDRANWFVKAVRSILDQSYSASGIRIYLGVDGPLPPSLESAIKSLDCFYKIVRNETNIGLTRSLNKLIDTLEGERYVFRMDSDDICHSERFRRQVDFLDRHSAIGIVGTGCYEIDKHGNRLRRRLYPQHPGYMLNFICKANPMLHPTMCFRGELLESGLRYPVRYRINQDLAIAFVALHKGVGLANIPECLLEWRVSNDFYKRRSISRSWSEFSIYIRGIWGLHGLTWRYVYPLARLGIRMLPSSIIHWIYENPLRMTFLGSSHIDESLEKRMK